MLDEVTYNNVNKKAKNEHLSFGTSHDRFGHTGGAFTIRDVPGPGEYSLREYQGVSAAETRSDRFSTGVAGADYTAITSTSGEVGPGSYEAFGSTSGISHNVTMNTPWKELSSKGLISRMRSGRTR
ncbi:hypothetical protein Pmar_PMAR027437 [Perkinsus marinus ATCC 50983]|uniref:Uncharacterized protein n=1 Tax=Perkinsus marinus (strain ATCC 50983 / TXsc) TaxID=423536 RepID=C5KLT1_PERM5|nr:hypothetical protein Pmar_PMAR027437 [Perkinsus marinus ATCC 50983]EER14575.1 hypothetical protein Pmar_PMAR027437 [Perkinsus marinus ATCC 50983]|eukprot:XP_002782780.1 hypothetical protein Pmar_PMAR027437 [Perkinsus marinus ATCC 50983]